MPFIRGGRLYERLQFGFSSIPPLNRPIWIHALSVGEVISSMPLVRALKESYPTGDIVFSVTTTQGMKLAREELEEEVSFFFPMPLDFWWSVRRVVNNINPSFFILVETDLWPGLLHYLKDRGIKALLINGRISPRTFRTYRKYKYFVRMMLNVFEFCLMQSDLDRERVLQIGVAEDRAVTVGNIKFDREWTPMGEEEHNTLAAAFNFGPDEIIWVAGSTHDGEEEIIFDVFLRLRSLFSEIRLIIAPRKINRAEEILKRGLGKGLNTVLKTELTGVEAYDVLILNTIGELGRIYGLATMSFVGGSLVPIGGHNLLEPANFGRPVLFGPHMHNFVLMSQLLVESGGGRQVENREELFETMQQLLSNPKKMERMGEKAKGFVEMNRGALARVIAYIESCL